MVNLPPNTYNILNVLLAITINKVLINEDMNQAALSAFKVSLFLLVRNYFSFSVLNKKHQSEIDDINEYLIGIFANE